MKRILLRLLFASILLFGLVACGSNPGPVLPPGAFTVESAKATTNTSVLVTFNSTVGDGGDNASYYEISNPDLQITAASVDGDRVTLTTSAQTAQIYTLRVSNIKDTDGNLIDTASTVTFNGEASTAPPASTLEETLETLGVNLDLGKRKDGSGKELPDSFSPLGPTVHLGSSASSDDSSPSSFAHPSKELFIANRRSLRLLEQDDQGNPKTLRNFNANENTWIDDTRTEGQSFRDVAAADLDGDGIEEVVAVYLDRGDNTIKARIIRRESEDIYTDSAPADTIGSGAGVVDVAVAAGDFTGDGTDGLAVVLSYAARAEVLFIESQSNDLTVVNTKALGEFSSNAHLSAELATGNLDYDGADELAIVQNDFIPTLATSGLGLGSSRYVALDDAGRGFAELGSGDVEDRIVADVALGDIDADGLAEVVLGGISRFATNSPIPLPNENKYPIIVLNVLDDAEHNLSEISRLEFIDCPRGSTCGSRDSNVRFIHINTFDHDGNGVKEIAANQYVFELVVDEATPNVTTGTLNEIYHIRDDDFFINISSLSLITSTTSAVAVADVTNDVREDIVVNTSGTVVAVFGLIEGSDSVNLLGIFRHILGGSQPVIVPVSIDTDGPVLRYLPAEDNLIFTEPLIVAAIAAPPCSRTSDQNWQDCKTTYGIGESSATDRTRTVSTTAGYHYGVKAGLEGKVIEASAEYRETITTTTRRSTGNHYSLEKTVFYTTGALEDSVIFTTIPYDQYTYTTISHPDKDKIGEEIVISVPREPITILSDLDFYNATVTNQNIKIDERVFAHTTGDINSYLSTLEKNQILSGIPSDQWVENGPQNVGIGTGTVTLELSEEKSSSFGRAFSRDTETNIEGTGEITLGFFKIGGGGGSISGNGEENSFTVTTGRLTKFIGTVGSIRGSLQDSYKTGLFAYTKELDGQEFTVINYWVE